jgi:hypothetical protein
MELAWPRLANEETAIAIVVDKDTRKKVATTNAIDREQIFRSMDPPPRKLIEMISQFRCAVYHTIKGARAARAAGSQPHLASRFHGRCKIATLHAGFGVIRGMSVEL